MRIYSMTATFGKLEHQTLTLKPGLNVIHAPNEWGKSTWCAFLTAMLYGLDTRSHSTRTALSDKDRFTPWSGTPMSGRMDLNWNGRDITLERRTKGRSIFGEFRAYETASGLPVPELNAANCGQTLLGVEKSVFTRSGFIRLADLPVTQDETLRRRLNALVTTGDETNTGDLLAQKLKDLKNRCRYNRTGLLPQAEARQAALEQTLRELDALQTQSRRLAQREAELTAHRSRLENHRRALLFAAARDDAARVAQAEAAAEESGRRLQALEDACAREPDRTEVQQQLRELLLVYRRWNSAQMEDRMIPPAPVAPAIPAPFGGMTPEDACEKARQDVGLYQALTKSRPLLPILGIAALAAGGLLAAFLSQWWYVGAAVAAAGIGALTAHFLRRSARNRQAQELAAIYGTATPGEWIALAESFARDRDAYTRRREEHLTLRGDLDHRLEQLAQELSRLCMGQAPEEAIDKWQALLSRWDELENARRDHLRTVEHAKTLRDMAKDAPPPEFEDTLTFSAPDTARLLSDADQDLQRLRLQLGQCQGQMDALGQREPVLAELEALRLRIGRLEDTYAALTLALQTLEAASAELQRRFAPRIAQRAQELFCAFTGARYEKLMLTEDLSVHACAQGEDTLRSPLWRSDGTSDQLYLALRLAVAEELTPGAPLVLDDALVRFDDDRLKSALEVLRQQAQTRQILLFTCQGREQRLLDS